jgi:mannitol-1-phosphate/altronate dehydrogenase
VRLSALALAGWCQYLLGMDEQGREIVLSADPRLELATRHAEASRSDPGAFLGMVEVFGERLPTDPVFRPAFEEALTSIREAGVHATLQRWLGEA